MGKFTLDMTKLFEWYQFKSIVLVQAATIVLTRGYVWFFHVYLMLSKFWADGSMNFFYGGCLAATLMSFFNLVMLADAIGAAVKWLPRAMPKVDTKEHHDIQNDLTQLVPPTPAKGTMKGSLTASSVLGLSPASAFRTDVTVIMAAMKFKKGLKRRTTLAQAATVTNDLPKNPTLFESRPCYKKGE